MLFLKYEKSMLVEDIQIVACVCESYDAMQIKSTAVPFSAMLRIDFSFIQGIFYFSLENLFRFS